MGRPVCEFCCEVIDSVAAAAGARCPHCGMRADPGSPAGLRPPSRIPSVFVVPVGLLALLLAGVRASETRGWRMLAWDSALPFGLIGVLGLLAGVAIIARTAAARRLVQWGTAISVAMVVCGAGMMAHESVTRAASGLPQSLPCSIGTTIMLVVWTPILLAWLGAALTSGAFAKAPARS